MKKITLILLFLLICVNIIAEKITDYFPFKLYIGYYYDRLEPTKDGSLRDSYVECVELAKKEGEILGAFEKTFFVGGLKFKNVEIYAIGENQVFLTYIKTSFSEKVYTFRPIILKMPTENQKRQWIDKPYDSDEEKYIYTAEFSSAKTNYNEYDDCIKVKKKIYIKKEGTLFSLYGTEIYYYAKNVGLVKEEFYDENNDLRGMVSKELVKIE